MPNKVKSVTQGIREIDATAGYALPRCSAWKGSSPSPTTTAIACCSQVSQRVWISKPLLRRAGLGWAAKSASWCSFVSLLDTEVDKRLTKSGSREALGLRGKAAVANARQAYSAYQKVFVVGDRDEKLKPHGALVQRPLSVSTDVKKLDYAETLYVIERCRLIP